ncbi:hypothetical protein CRG98_022784 [Punica granatum]|uniref:Uncharacterized protein n=1 Tax=Punica granatum TaxID=22663 RepID=A0A2I0JMT6_PUNGR|nr:hypothetical protein CRG98_022784 [Punica granatum]
MARTGGTHSLVRGTTVLVSAVAGGWGMLYLLEQLSLATFVEERLDSLLGVVGMDGLWSRHVSLWRGEDHRWSTCECGRISLVMRKC